MQLYGELSPLLEFGQLTHEEFESKLFDQALFGINEKTQTLCSRIGAFDSKYQATHSFSEFHSELKSLETMEELRNEILHPISYLQKEEVATKPHKTSNQDTSRFKVVPSVKPENLNYGGTKSNALDLLVHHGKSYPYVHIAIR